MIIIPITRDPNCLKPGDKVRIVERRDSYDEHDHLWNNKGEMDCHLGSIMTVRSVERDSRYGFIAKMMEDKYEFCGNGWCWYPNMIAGIVTDTLQNDNVDDWCPPPIAMLM